MALQRITEGLVFISNPVHATYFPYPIAPTIHAARTSIAYQTNARTANAASGGKASWPTYIAGYLVMAWGGTILTHHLLQLPAPMLYSITPYIIYLTTHLTLTLVFTLFPTLLSPTFPFLALLDTVIFPLDALVRTSSVTSTLVHFAPSSTSVAPALAASPITHLIIGALASSGGGLSASTLSTWSQNWSFSTPPVLRAPTLTAFWWASMDVWGGALVAAVYGTLTGHGAFTTTRQLLGAAGLSAEQMWQPLEAKAVCAAVLGVCFGLRAYKVHWRSPAAPVGGKAPVKKGTKSKAQ